MPQLFRTVLRALGHAGHANRTPRSHPPPRFRLPDLPDELQDMIFSICLATGNTRILMLSKKIHNRIVPIIYRDAYLRLDPGPGDSPQTPTPPSNLPLIRNISVHLDGKFLKTFLAENRPGAHFVPILDFAQPLWTTDAQGRIFHLSISRKDKYLDANTHLLSRLITGLTTFEVVTVTAVTKKDLPSKKCHLSPRNEYLPDPRVFRARNREIYKIFRQEWEGSLGPAKFHDSLRQEGRYLEFRPRAHLAILAAGSS